MRRHLVPLAFFGAAALGACGGDVSSSRTTTATPRVTASAGLNTRTTTRTPPVSTPDPSTPSPPARTRTPPGPTGDSGVEGKVTIGPTCPVQRIDSPCPDRAYEATIDVLDAARNRVTETRSDADGHFRVLLPPGTYVLAPRTEGVPPTASEQAVMVVSGRITVVEIIFDSGIR